MLLPASTGSGESDLVSARLDRKSTGLNSSERWTSYAVSCSNEDVLAVLEMLVVREESTLTTRVPHLLSTALSVVMFDLFFQGLRVPRHLHSFPTRRSSDLSDRLTPVASDGPLFVTVSV